MLRENFYKISSWVSVLPILFLPKFVLAGDAKPGVYSGLGGAKKSLTDVSTGATASGGAIPTDLPHLIGQLISVLLGVLGIILVVMVIYAGVLYMTAAGDDTKIKTAKKILVNSIIGLVLIVAAYAISSFVINMIVSATSTKTPASEG